MKFTGWVEGGRLPREPQPGESKIHGRNIAGIPVNQPGGGVSGFYILPGKTRQEPGRRIRASRRAVCAQTKMQIIVWRERAGNDLPPQRRPNPEESLLSGCGAS